MLDQLQPDEVALGEGEKPQGCVFSCDFYNAGAIQALCDEDITDTLMKALLPSAVPPSGLPRSSIHLQALPQCRYVVLFGLFHVSQSPLNQHCQSLLRW